MAGRWYGVTTTKSLVPKKLLNPAINRVMRVEHIPNGVAALLPGKSITLTAGDRQEAFRDLVVCLTALGELVEVNRLSWDKDGDLRLTALNGAGQSFIPEMNRKEIVLFLRQHGLCMEDV